MWGSVTPPQAGDTFKAQGTKQKSGHCSSSAAGDFGALTFTKAANPEGAERFRTHHWDMDFRDMFLQPNAAIKGFNIILIQGELETERLQHCIIN